MTLTNLFFFFFLECEGTIVSFASDGSDGEYGGMIQATHIDWATSVKWGYGPGFNSSNLYATEGGGLTALRKSKRVLEIIPQ